MEIKLATHELSPSSKDAVFANCAALVSLVVIDFIEQFKPYNFQSHSGIVCAQSAVYRMGNEECYYT